MSGVACLLEFGRQHSHVNVSSDHVAGVNIVLVGLVRPLSSEKGHLRRRTDLEDMMVVKDQTCTGQHVKVGDLDGGTAETHIYIM